MIRGVKSGQQDVGHVVRRAPTHGPQGERSRVRQAYQPVNSAANGIAPASSGLRAPRKSIVANLPDDLVAGHDRRVGPEVV